MKYFSYFLLCTIAILPTSVAAFESDEHKRMGDRAFAISLAMNRISCSGNAGKWSFAQKEICSLSTETTNENVDSYGDIITKVDFLLSPGTYLHQIGRDVDYPRSHAELNQSYSLAAQSQRKLSGILGSALRASHNNDAHFQGALHAELHEWHRRAYYIAQKNNSVFSALVSNAISDHFLHDYFAPGHITTPRYNFHDLFAVGMHDLHNTYGARIKIKNWNQFEPILSFLKDNSDQFDLTEEMTNEIDELLKLNDYLYLHGDGDLVNNPRQELFITLVESLFLNDLIACSLNNEKCSGPRLKKYTWIPSTIDRHTKELFPPQSKTYFAEYMVNSKMTKQYAMVLGASIGQDVFYGGNNQEDSRLSLSLETVPFGWPGSPDFLRYSDNYKPLARTNFAPVLGIKYISSNEYDALGPSVRLVWAYPKIDTQIGIFADRLKYEASNGSTSFHEYTYGARVDIGFSLLTAYMSVGNSFAVQNDLKKAGNVLSFGFTISSPTTRIPVLKNLSKTIARNTKLKVPDN